MARDSVTRLGRNKWRLRYDAPWSTRANRSQRSSTFTGTKKAAQAELARIIHEIAQGSYKETTLMSMEEYANVKVRERTLRGYRTIVNNHIKPAFGSIMLDELTSRHIQRYYADCMKRGLSARTVHHIHRLLRQSLRQAVDWDMTEKNPADDATPPAPTRPDIVPLSPAQTQRVMQIASGTDYFIPIFLGIYTGMRRSEVLGLIWRNVHLEQNGIAVLQTMVDIPGDPTHIAQPKSKTSRRSIGISDNITRVLRQHRHDMFFDHARHSLTVDQDAPRYADGGVESS